jgi:hypothetical protein
MQPPKPFGSVVLASIVTVVIVVEMQLLVMGPLKLPRKKGVVVRTSLTVIVSTIVSSGQLAGAVGCTSPKCLDSK